MRIIKSLLIYIIIALLSQTTNAQNNILGKVIDEDGNALPYANALLLISVNNELMRGAVSSENGDFILKNIPKGKYLLQVSMVGFSTTTSEPFIFEGNAPLQLPVMKLSETLALAEVEIKADKPLYVQKIDRMVINVASSILSAGTTALEVLERSPGVLVNRQDNSISIVGKDGVVVMMNGKLSYMPTSSLVQLLDGMSSDNIESIELITTPPANFDAEGNAGYINIVLKKNLDAGLNGSYSLSGGIGNGTTTSDNINFNYRKNKINIFGDYGYSRRNQGQLWKFSRSFLNANDIQTDLTTVTDRDPSQRNHSLRLGLDYQATEKTIIGTLVSANDNKWSMDAFNTSEQNENDIPSSFIEILNTEINSIKNIRINMNVKHDFKKDGYVNFDVDYLYFDTNNPNTYVNSYFDGDNNFLEEEFTKSDKITPMEVMVGNADYSNQLNDKIKLETGIKAAFITFGNDVSVETFDGQNFVPNPTLTSNSDLDESILAAYTSLGYSISDNTDLKLGLRYEHTVSELVSDTRGILVDRSYGELFPTAYLSHKINDSLSFGASYSRRITRPSLREMAPFVIFFDPSTLISGNPSVQPALSNNIAFTTNYLSYLLKVEYSIEKGTIARFTPTIDPDSNLFTYQAENLDKTNVFSITLGLPLTIANWWKTQNNFTYLNTITENDNGEFIFKSEQSTFRANSSHSFTITDNFTSEINMNYRGAGQFGYSITEPIFAMNIGFQQKLNGAWGTLKFSINDLLDSRIWKSTTNIPELNLKSVSQLRFSNRTFILTYTRNFGNKGVKSSRNRRSGAEDEINRVN